MSTGPIVGFPEAARRLGVSIRALRRAIRAGKIEAPAALTATSALPAAWLAATSAAVAANPALLGNSSRPKVPPFARYAGTSAWRKYKIRVREYANYRATVG